MTAQQSFNGFRRQLAIRAAGTFLLTVVAPLTIWAAQPTVPKADESGFRETLSPFLAKYCLNCHGPEDQQGEFRVDRHLPNDFLNHAAQAKWGEVVNVLNSHEMPPEDETQPAPEEVSRVVDWITQQMVRAELHRRDSAIVLRRLNRSEYQNTIRDLVGIDFDPARFPQDPPTGGFDNNGGALTVSPLHLELYFEAARDILDQTLVEGDRPPSITWRFEPDSGDSDSNRVVYDGQRVIVNGGKSRVERGFKVMHHESWDRKLNARDFRVPHGGAYVVRIRAAGRVPARDEVVSSAETFLAERRDRELKKNPDRARWVQPQYERDLKHFADDRMYDYGPPRLKLIQNLGGQPRVLTEFDVPAPLDAPEIYEVPCRFTTERAGLTIEYAYSIPKELENFWLQSGDAFARPELWVDWFEIEGPLFSSWPPPSHQRILFASPLRQTDERAYAREVIQRFMRRAFRRPVSDAEVATKLALFDRGGDSPRSFIEAIKVPLTAILVSPHFLYLAEPLPDDEHHVAATENRRSAGPIAVPPATGRTAASDRATPFRVFASQKGSKISARVLAVNGQQFTIRRRDGKQFTVPITAVSAEDQAYLQSWRPAQTVAAETVAAETVAAEAGAAGTETAPAGARHLDGFQLASRFSYFLWSSMPDEHLWKLAANGTLTDRQVLAAEVDQMLADPKSEAFVENFAGQWLGLREVGANPPAADLFPRYDRHLEASIQGESLAFFREILQQDLSVMNFVRSNFVVINERLGRYYGIPGVRGDHFRRVQVPAGVHRGGVVTQASVLSITSNGTRTSPVKRGVWIMKNMLGIDPGLPVANAGEIAPKVPGIDKATVRKRLEIHRELPQCARCHDRIDPLGFALENFNAAGDWREREGFGYKGRIGDNDPLIDASSKLLDGTQITGVDGLQRALIEQEDLFLQCLIGKMLTYALGRELGLADQVHIKAGVARLKAEGPTLRALITFVVTSEPFLTK